MELIRKQDNIIITHYVNPHMFWFKYQKDARSEEILILLNEKLQKYVLDNVRKHEPYSPRIGEIILCYNGEQWIRGKVDQRLTNPKETKFIVWAIDYG